MANHKSAIKRHKQSLKHAARNRAARTRVKNAVKAVRAAITGNDKEQASSALTVAASVLAKAAGKGLPAWEADCRTALLDEKYEAEYQSLLAGYEVTTNSFAMTL